VTGGRGWRLALGALVLGLAACGSSGSDQAAQSATTSPATGGPPATATPPSVPPGGKDCGTVDEISGWPTTAVPSPDAFTCITDAATAGTPARMIVVTAGAGISGQKTSDGYDLPTHVVVTWVVQGPNDVQQTTDRSEDGAGVTTENCTGLSAAGLGTTPAGTGCRPA
jgi:hypothetical protein